MGIISEFGNILKKGIDFVKINKKMNTIFRPFFHDLAYKFNYIKIIEKSIPSEVKSIYLEIKETKIKQYQRDIKKYENTIYDINEHNSKVRKIMNGINGFDYHAFINDPFSLTTDKIANYYEIAKLIDSFYYKDKKYIQFSEEVKDVKENHKTIISQFNTLKKLEKITILDDIYIDCSFREKLINEYEELQKVFNNSSGKHYYDFSKYYNFNDLINKHNEEYISKRIQDKIFDNINGKSLDKEQRKAVLDEEISSLVIAGAGSGKTLTICGKVKYLLERKEVSPDELLLLSYSKKSAEDLQEKIGKVDNKITVSTFHKLGLDILKEKENKKYVVEEQFKAIIDSYFRVEIKNRPEMLEKIMNYYALYISSNKTSKKYENAGQLYAELKEADFNTLKCQLLDLSNNTEKKETIKKEYVRSYEELAIANFLFINGIDYEYEKPYCIDVSTIDRRQYTPDFYLPKYGIYLEHYGVDKNGHANQFSRHESIRYEQDMMWKRQLHKVNNTKCLETYSYEFEEGTIFENLKERLKESNVIINPLSKEEILNVLNYIYEGQPFKSFINLLCSFINLYKSRYTTNIEFEELKKSRFDNLYEKKRAAMFLDIAKDIYEFYMESIRKENKIDFDDMILKSTAVLPSMNSFNYKYIIVDEFQDISYSRMLFLKQLIKHGNSRLFCVGDDWQAIYRFSGCDLNIFLKFEEYFGFCSKSFITTTHRNSQDLQEIVGDFIRKNKKQLNKTINSAIRFENPIRLVYYENKYSALMKVFESINKNNPKARILLLGRNNNDIDTVLSTKLIKIPVEDATIIKSLDYPQFKIRYSTVHSAKGLEEEIVVLINADNAKLGFPNKLEDDELLNLVLSSKDDFQYAEERRLWYVALTRTKTVTYILVNKENPSIFVEEIKDKCKIVDLTKSTKIIKQEACPNCKSGHLILKTVKSKKAYACSNYPYCKYLIFDIKAVNSNKRCICGDFMILKKGNYGWFYGCNSYPRCNHTEKYVYSQNKKD